MPLAGSPAGFLSNEWERFLSGIRQLDPHDQDRISRELQQSWSRSQTPPTLSIPGWDDVVHLTPRFAPDPADVREYWQARREHRAPHISDEAKAELDRRAAAVRRVRSSTAPVYAQAFGQVLTALDNVQDLMSTLSTFGRLAMWASPRILGRLAPGVGLILLGSDILNLMSFLAMLATPLYALLCAGPMEALASGLPSLLLKQGLKRETWRLAALNPWGATARTRRLGRVRYPTIGVGHLLEIAQTTDQLFGVGLSLGGIVGALQEAAYGVILESRGADVRINRDGPYRDWVDLMRPRFEGMGLERLRAGHSAAGVLLNGPLIASVQHHFTVDEHLNYLAALHAAIEITADDLRGLDFHGILNDALTVPLKPSLSVDLATDLQLRVEFPRVRPVDRWFLPGAPETITPAQYAQHITANVPRAVYDLIVPRRTHPQGMLAGALVNQTAHSLWLMLERDPHFFKWRFSTDMRIIAGMAEQGLLIAPTNPEDQVLELWNDYRDVTERKDRQTLCPCNYLEPARKRGVHLVRLLPTEAPLPPTWDAAAVSTDDTLS